ncbi:hypothetical protein C7444_101333 [Sphaerotilus hippei]|uniref:YgjP-like metallopeptidase domain-containing protein n=1 Tax=Sphaerotilus hippei TaxID=744406 RepID=A0A318HHG2_9BURK|nr:SprT family zinc-dependent metalloprotease [Sphaerotilus hippei]PXW99503.1 hypothetical protein C7444_101333 [Sphaerotilus hippei]
MTQASPAPPWRHVRSNRSVQLGPQLVGYELGHARRRTIGFVVGPEGLVVRAPRWVAQADIDDALRSKAAWILRKLAEQAERVLQRDTQRVQWAEGGSLPYLGTPLTLTLVPGQRGVVLGADRRLQIGLGAAARPEDTPADHLRHATLAWLQRQALTLFQERVLHHAPRLQVQPRQLRLSAARTRWGSASSDGTVRLNWRLIHFELPVIDYVVVHELAHLREMNHGPAFWALVHGVMPDYEHQRHTLKTRPVPVCD